MKTETQEPVKEARVVVRYLKISPRKVRLVIDAVRRKPVGVALTSLLALKKKAARLVERGLKSAVANAKVKGLEENRLVVSKIYADGGPVMKRFMSRSMGRADRILKRTTHLSIFLREGSRSHGLPPGYSQSKGKAEKEAPPKKRAVKTAG